MRGQGRGYGSVGRSRSTGRRRAVVVHLEFHVIGIESMVIIGLKVIIILVIRWWIYMDATRERILILASECMLVRDNDVRDLEVFHDSVQVSEVDTTTREIVTQFIFTVQNIDSIMN